MAVNPIFALALNGRQHTTQYREHAEYGPVVENTEVAEETVDHQGGSIQYQHGHRIYITHSFMRPGAFAHPKHSRAGNGG